MLENLEINLTVDDSSNFTIIQNTASLMRRLVPYYKGYARLLVTFKTVTKDPNLFIRWVDEEENSERLHFNLRGTPKEILGYNLNTKYLKYWETFIKINCLQDAIDLEKLSMSIDFIVFVLNGDNIDEIIQAYHYLAEKQLQVSFSNIKIDESFEWNERNKEKLTHFFLPLLEKHYYYDVETQQVYNKAAVMPIKGFRPLYKYMYKFSYGKAYQNIEQLPNGLFRYSLSNLSLYKNPPERTLLNISELEEILLNPPEIVPIGFYCNNCTICDLKGACSNNAAKENLYECTDLFCKEAKFSSIPLQILQNLSQSDDKIEWFQNPENRIMA